jgi:predicted nucleotidyltransferase
VSLDRQEYLKAVVARVVENYQPDRILLFGSQARNEAKDSSDFDLLIVKDSEVPRWRRGKNIQALFTFSPVKLDLIFMTPREIESERANPHSFISNVLDSAQLVYSREQATANAHSSTV